MTEPTPAPVDPAVVFALDQAVIDAGRVLLDALTARPTNPEAITEAEERLRAARVARWGPDA